MQPIPSIDDLISGFFLFGAVCVLVDFIFQVTFFVACLALDERRMQQVIHLIFSFHVQNRLDCLPCFPAPKPIEITENSGESSPIQIPVESTQSEYKSMMSSFFGHYYANFLLKPPVKITLVRTLKSFFDENFTR